MLMFDQKGTIFYGNTIAREKLEYENDLYGKNISDVFPNTFKNSEDGFETLPQY